MNNELKDQVAVVTGAARGIGRAIAETLAKKGASVIICDIMTEEANKASQEIGSNYGVKTYALAFDVSKSEDVEKAFKEIIEKFSRIDILVNNAGITKMPYFSG